MLIRISLASILALSILLSACADSGDEAAIETAEGALVTPRGEILLELPPVVADFSAWSARTIWQANGAHSRALPIGAPLSVPAGSTCVSLFESGRLSETRCGLKVPAAGRLTLKPSWVHIDWRVDPAPLDVVAKGSLAPPTTPVGARSAILAADEGWPWATGGATTDFVTGLEQHRDRLLLPGRFTATYPGMGPAKRTFDVPEASELTLDVSPNNVFCTIEVDYPTQAFPDAAGTYVLVGPNAFPPLRATDFGRHLADASAVSYSPVGYREADGVARLRLTPKSASDTLYLLVSGQKQTLACAPGKTTRARVRVIDVPGDAAIDRYEVSLLDPVSGLERPMAFYVGGEHRRVGGRPGTSVFVLPGRYLLRTFRDVEVIEERTLDLP